MLTLSPFSRQPSEKLLEFGGYILEYSMNDMESQFDKGALFDKMVDLCI